MFSFVEQDSTQWGNLNWPDMVQSERLDTIVETAELAQEFKAHRDPAPQSSRSGAKAPPNMNPAQCLAHPHSIEIRMSQYGEWEATTPGACR